MKIKALIFAVFIVGWQTQAIAETLWFVIGATNRNLLPIFEVKKNLTVKWPEATIITTDDCIHDKPGLFILVAKMTSSKAIALSALKALKKQIQDAYLFSCTIKPNSRLAIGVSLIDPSIEKGPRDLVNWSDNDRVTELRHLKNDAFLIIKKLYDPEDQSFREGRRVDILFLKGKPENASLLTRNCWDFGGLSYTENLLAFHCASTVAGEHLIHRVEVFRLKPQEKIFEKDYCRNPVLLGEKYLKCEEETVNWKGKLFLNEVNLSLVK